MKLTSKQKAILDHFRTKEEMTKREAVNIIGGCYYHNADHHVGEVLTRMVKANILERKKKGVYTLRTKSVILDVNQKTIF